MIVRSAEHARRTRVPARRLGVNRLFIFALCLLLACSDSAPAADTDLAPPLVRAKYAHISTSAEMRAYIDALAARYPGIVTTEVLGQTVQGRDIEAVRLQAATKREEGQLKVLIIGSQHGAAEPAGGEALLQIALELAAGKLHPLLDEMEVILLPNANPDGRDLKRRSNASRVNINTDFVLLSQPESRALKAALARYMPDAVLDSHESAVLKRHTLAREGYLTDFDAQFEVGNNPAIPVATRDFALVELLPVLTARVTQGGLRAQRYIGEITSTRQAITNGGLTLRNFRNTAAMNGALSFLVETKLDSPDASFTTYRNIGVRLERQLLCIRTFLDLLRERRAEVLEHVRAARDALHREPLTLFADYVQDPAHPTVEIPLRRLDTRVLENFEFRDHRKVRTAQIVPYPPMLVVAAHDNELRTALERHDITFWRVSQPMTVEVIAARFSPLRSVEAQLGATLESKTNIEISPHSLLVDLGQPNGRYAALLLDPRSVSSIFRYPEYASLIKPEHDFFIYRTFKGATRTSP